MGKHRKDNEDQVIIGSGNVFADLGLPDPDELIIKAKLVHKISLIIKERGLTQTQAAQILGIDQPKISALLKGKFSGFSIERLIKYLNAFDTKVDLIFSNNSNSNADTTRKRVATTPSRSQTDKRSSGWQKREASTGRFVEAKSPKTGKRADSSHTHAGSRISAKTKSSSIKPDKTKPTKK